ncbi:type IV secretory system conjugative DNA transfer family protein [Streptomyces sp. NPDC057702]|uniref:type IV secretory system conjugative DNA transfer family protein n=1 Tax=Streptomyces sp. NPDC057702 TaxID=3346221 RepID=UPI0036BC8457
MSELDPQHPAPAPAPGSASGVAAGSAATERAVAIATSAAPLATALVTPFLDGGAAFTATLAYGATAGVLAANYMHRLPTALTAVLPGSDILSAHRSTLFTSTITSGMALGMGALAGPAGADALMAGVLTLPSVSGVISAGWWGAVALVPLRLRRILQGRGRPAAPGPGPEGGSAPAPPPTAVEQILARWSRYISHPTSGTHRRQELTVTSVTGTRWQGLITAPAGAAVTVSAEAVSSVYQVPTAWVTIARGDHAGARRLTVNLTPPPELNASTLAGAWLKHVATTVMKGSHLEAVQEDPVTGGEVAWVVADDDQPRLSHPTQEDLAGALRTTTLLCSYTATPGDPRRGQIRLMKHNPLQKGVEFPGRHVLEISEGGYVQIGTHVSGWPARLQVTDPHLGARHVFVAGVTGSGKGGIVQLVALADHVNAISIIYADPKGSSNPDIPSMAAFSGLGEAGTIGALRVIYALLQWRIEESARLGMKNFQATPERPWVRFILDEAHVPLSESEHSKEAGIIMEALAAKARSLGIILALANQAVNADKLGGSTTLRTNVIQGGSLVMLRTDSDQKHLASTGFEGVDPGQIPATWDTDPRPLVYDPTQPLPDPRSTFGLGYTLGPGGSAEMMRAFILESAAPYIDPTAVIHPVDWPDWDQREEIAATSILPDADDPLGSGGGGWGTPSPSKPKASADDKIVKAMEDASDPLGLEAIYLAKADIAKISGVTGSTLDNALSRLVTEGRIHRQVRDGKEVRGFYGAGPTPEDTTNLDTN